MELMNGNLKHQFLFKDRLDIVFDIAMLMTGRGLIITNMAEGQKDGFVEVFKSARILVGNIILEISVLNILFLEKGLNNIAD